MKILKYNVLKTILLLTILSLVSCSGGDEYLKFTQNGEVSYTAKIDSAKVFPGRNRVKVEGLILSDPKVTQLRVFWNNRADSVVVPIVRTKGIDKVSTIIAGLAENVYNFELRTYDAQGNKSIAHSITAEVFGARYQASLNDRPIVTSSLSSNLSLTINFAAMDLTTGAFATEVVYTDKFDVEQTLTVPVATSQVIIPNYKIGSQFKQRSLFLPAKNAIDIFYTPFVLKVPDVIDLSYMIKNNARPFMASASSGRWGDLADWTTNAACKNHGGYGGIDFGCCGNPPQSINLESGWGSPIITNGKIYQTMTLDAGTYIFSSLLLAGGSGINSGYTLDDYTYLAVAKGNILPDSSGGTLDTNPATLGFKRIVNTMKPDSAVITFTLTQTTQISLGISTTQGDARYGHFLSFNLLKKNK
jgi:hypothetical protein